MDQHSEGEESYEDQDSQQRNNEKTNLEAIKLTKLLQKQIYGLFNFTGLLNVYQENGQKLCSEFLRISPTQYLVFSNTSVSQFQNSYTLSTGENFYLLRFRNDEVRIEHDQVQWIPYNHDLLKSKVYHLKNDLEEPESGLPIQFQWKKEFAFTMHNISLQLLLYNPQMLCSRLGSVGCNVCQMPKCFPESKIQRFHAIKEFPGYFFPKKIPDTYEQYRDQKLSERTKSFERQLKQFYHSRAKIIKLNGTEGGRKKLDEQEELKNLIYPEVGFPWDFDFNQQHSCFSPVGKRTSIHYILPYTRGTWDLTGLVTMYKKIGMIDSSFWKGMWSSPTLQWLYNATHHNIPSTKGNIDFRSVFHPTCALVEKENYQRKSSCFFSFINRNFVIEGPAKTGKSEAFHRYSSNLDAFEVPFAVNPFETYSLETTNLWDDTKLGSLTFTGSKGIKGIVDFVTKDMMVFSAQQLKPALVNVKYGTLSSYITSNIMISNYSLEAILQEYGYQAKSSSPQSGQFNQSFSQDPRLRQNTFLGTNATSAISLEVSSLWQPYFRRFLLYKTHLGCHEHSKNVFQEVTQLCSAVDQYAIDKVQQRQLVNLRDYCLDIQGPTDLSALRLEDLTHFFSTIFGIRPLQQLTTLTHQADFFDFEKSYQVDFEIRMKSLGDHLDAGWTDYQLRAITNQPAKQVFHFPWIQTWDFLLALATASLALKDSMLALLSIFFQIRTILEISDYKIRLAQVQGIKGIYPVVRDDYYDYLNLNKDFLERPGTSFQPDLLCKSLLLQASKTIESCQMTLEQILPRSYLYNWIKAIALMIGASVNQYMHLDFVVAQDYRTPREETELGQEINILASRITQANAIKADGKMLFNPYLWILQSYFEQDGKNFAGMTGEGVEYNLEQEERMIYD